VVSLTLESRESCSPPKAGARQSELLWNLLFADVKAVSFRIKDKG